MATLTQSFLTLADVYKRSNPDGSAADIMEILNDTSQDILTDFMYRECNSGTSHLHTVRAGLMPIDSWGALYEGIPQVKSGTQQVTDTTGFVQRLCSVDTRVLELAKNEAAVRASESRAVLESMAQELVTALFYHDPAADVRKPKGLGPRYGALATSGYGNQIVDAGGTGSDNTSIWFVTWGDDAVQALYPEGTQGGIKQQDKGEQPAYDDNGLKYFVKEELVTSHLGFSVRDYRRVSRVANVDVSALAAGSVDIYDYMRKAYYKLHGRRASKVRDQDANGHTVIYCNTDVLEALDALGTNGGSSDNFIRLHPMEIAGKEVLSYRGMPIRETDALLNTETRIV